MQSPSFRAICLASGFAFSVATSLPAVAQPYLTTPQVSERPCESDVIAVEVPLWADPLPVGAVAQLQSALSSTTTKALFCPSCPLSQVSVSVTPLLPDLADRAAFPDVPESRRDGHHRFLVVSASTMSGAPLSIEPDSACAAVEEVRHQVAALVGAPSGTGQPHFLVSRECLVGTLDAEAHLDAAAIDWAMARIGAASGPPGSRVGVALVDTGVRLDLHATLGVVFESSLPPPEIYRPTRTEHHPHGAWVAAAIHAVAPHAELFSLRALDGQGVATVGAVARALDGVIPLVRSRDLEVVNLSLGFPPHLARPAPLAGPGCRTHEDGLGASLRYVIQSLGETTPAGGPLLIAAGGNAILEQDRYFRGGIRTPPVTPCGFDAAPAGASAFFPAGFGEMASCGRARVSAGPPTLVGETLRVLPVGATDDRDRRALLTLAEAEPLVLAPGEGVHLRIPGAPSSPAPLACGAGDVGLERGFESPASVSGTSISAGLVSGAAARALGVGGRAWSPEALARLIYLTGIPVCQPLGGVDNGGFGLRRRLSVDRLLSAVEPVNSVRCRDLLSCVQSASHPRGPMVSPDLAMACGSALSKCLTSPTTEFGCADRRPPPSPSPSYLASLSAAPQCVDRWRAGPVSVARAPGRGYEVFEDVQGSSSRPLPLNGGCARCTAELVASVDPRFMDLILRGEMTDTLPHDMEVSDAFVALFGGDKSLLGYFPLGAPHGAFLPGHAFEVVVEGAVERHLATIHLTSGAGAALDLELKEGGVGRRTARMLIPLALH